MMSGSRVSTIKGAGTKSQGSGKGERREERGATAKTRGKVREEKGERRRGKSKHWHGTERSEEFLKYPRLQDSHRSPVVWFWQEEHIPVM